MDEMKVSLQLPDGAEKWLAAQGRPNFRSAVEQAGFLCSQYLSRAYKNGTNHGSKASNEARETGATAAG